MLVRRQDWPAALRDFVETRRHVPFAWGGNDCATFPGDCILAMTGTDIVAGFRDRYHDKLSAYRLLRAFAGAGIEAAARKIAAQFGMPETVPAFAQRGDWVLFDTAGEDALGLCLGAHLAGAGRHGIEFQPMNLARSAWRV